MIVPDSKSTNLLARHALGQRQLPARHAALNVCPSSSNEPRSTSPVIGSAAGWELRPK